ncbi:MAG: hypothetical protein MRJ67_12160 [Nitrospirales bacterium]|nr:hypothetical protein [Nitrospirales bacterium]
MAKDLGLNAALLGCWCREARQRGSKAFPGTGMPHDQEVARLKQELAVVTRERESLKEAAAPAPTRRRVWKTLHGLAHVASGVAGHSHSHALKTGKSGE